MVELKSISSNMEDYLKNIALLTADYGFARAVDIATSLRVKMPSVTKALKNLSQLGLIIYRPCFPVRLTEEGKERAEMILQRHNVLKCFFNEILCCPREKADLLACKIEHEVDEQIIYMICILNDAVKNRPECITLREYLHKQLTDSGHGKKAFSG